MGEVGMSSLQIVLLPMKENADGSICIDLSTLANPAVPLDACVQCAVEHCREKNKELRFKVTREYFSSITFLSQMGFNIIHPAESTDSYIVLGEAGKSLPVASDITLMPRGNITSSSKPHNLISSQSPRGAILAKVQTLSKETAFEQGLEFPHSSCAYPLGPIGLGNGNKAEGLKDFSAELETPGQPKYGLHPANESDGLPSKKPRGSYFEDKAKGLLLQGELEYLPDPTNEGFTKSQIPLAVFPTPWETTCEQCPDFQHSNQAYPSGPVDMGNGNEAAGLQGFSAGLQSFSITSEIPKCGVQTSNESELPSTRRRGSNFEDKEKGLVLQLKLKYLQDPANEGKGHKWSTFVSDSMRKNGYIREPKAVRGQWDTLKKSRDAMKRLTPQGTSYWDLTMDEKDAYHKHHDHHFPLGFEGEWYDTMENIEKLEPRRVAKKQTQRNGQALGVSSQLLASTITSSTNFAGASTSDANIQPSVQHPRQANTQGRYEGPYANLQGLGTIPSCIQDFASSSHVLREMDYQEIFCTKEEQLAVERELSVSASEKLTENRSLNSSEIWEDILQNPLADVDQAGCNELENQE